MLHLAVHHITKAATKSGSGSHAAIAAVIIGGIVALTVYALWRDKLPRARIWMLIVIGVVELGLLGSATVKFATWLIGAGNAVTDRAIGVACGAAFLAMLFACELWRTAAPGRWNGEGSNRGTHVAMALMFPSICIAAGGIVGTAFGMGSSLITTVADGINGLL